MKKALFCFLLLASVSAGAQSEKFVKAMEERLVAIDTIRSPQTLNDLSAAFERIALAEKTRWQPFYYAALTQVNRGYALMGNQMGGDPAVLDPVADKADALLAQAEALSKDNSEIYVVRKMILSLRMLVDPMNRFQEFGPKAQEALETARRLDPENPRTYLLEGQDLFFTPEQYGGSKEEAKKRFETALQKFETFKPKSSIDPVWGKAVAAYFMGQVK
ncbi:MAG TPA: hypothetical protein VHK69_06670 [Chitinophagaceae bacterium]|jgi:hypothetical protein|nr:hypothetical protein [Chitinophagaceae bacterium]